MFEALFLGMALSNEPALSIPLDVLLPRIIRECLYEGEACNLTLDANFMGAQFRTHQIFYLHSFALDKLHRRLPVKALARAFNIQAKDVRRALEKGDTIPSGRGRHPALDDEIEERLLEWIQKNAHNHTPVNRTELLHYCRETFFAAVTDGWVDSFLSRRNGELFEAISQPQENLRLEVPRLFLDTMIECLTEHVPGCCAELVFNLDEVGISEWEDRVARRVIVPRSMSTQTIHHGVHRNLKHISVLCCVSAAGESMTPFMVSSQVNDSVINGLKVEGFRMGLDLILEHRKKPYLTAELFHQYVTTVLLPFIDELRTNDEFAGKTAILLMDNCSIHTRPSVLLHLKEHNVKVITFPPHTTQIFQVLDLSLFGVLKRKTQYKLPLSNDNSTVKFIQKIFHSLKQTLIEDNVRNAFKMLGFEYDVSHTPYTLLFREEKLHGSRGFREIWEADYPLDQLSKRRREPRYGWINPDE